MRTSRTHPAPPFRQLPGRTALPSQAQVHGGAVVDLGEEAEGADLARQASVEAEDPVETGPDAIGVVPGPAAVAVVPLALHTATATIYTRGGRRRRRRGRRISALGVGVGVLVVEDFGREKQGLLVLRVRARVPGPWREGRVRLQLDRELLHRDARRDEQVVQAGREGRERWIRQQ